MGREPISVRVSSFTSSPCGVVVSCGISSRFQLLSPSQRQVAHALLTRPLLRLRPKTKPPFNLHVLSTPPAFVLSQDQTLSLKLFQRFFRQFYKLIASLLAYSLSGPLCTNIASCIVLYVIFKVPFSCAGLPGTELYINKYTRICQYPFCSARAYRCSLYALRSPAFCQARVRMLPYALQLCQRCTACISWQDLQLVFRYFPPAVSPAFKPFIVLFSQTRFQSAQI